MRKPMEINERIFRFMGRKHLQNPDVRWDHESLLVSPLPALSPQGGERGSFMGRVKGSPLAFRFQPMHATYPLRNGEQIRKCFHLFSLSGAVRRRPKRSLRRFRM